MSLLTESRLGDLRVAILEELVAARTVAFNAEVIVRRVVRSQVLDFEFTVAQAERELAELVKLSAQNLTEWRQGGYQDWKKRREQIDRTKDLADYSSTLAERNGGGATQGAAAITGGQARCPVSIISHTPPRAGRFKHSARDRFGGRRQRKNQAVSGQITPFQTFPWVASPPHARYAPRVSCAFQTRAC